MRSLLPVERRERHYRRQVPVSFLVDPTRSVAGPSGQEWSVLLRPGSAWPCWRWSDWVEERVDSGSPESALVLLPLHALTVPSAVFRRLGHVSRRRRDWSVSVYEGTTTEYRPRLALLHQVCASRGEGAALAETVARQLRAGWQP